MEKVMHRYILEQHRHGTVAMRNLTLEERLAKNARELLAWKHVTVRLMRRKFPQVAVDGLDEKGIVALLPDDSPEFLRRFQRELDCVASLSRAEPKPDLRDLLFRGAK